MLSPLGGAAMQALVFGGMSSLAWSTGTLTTLFVDTECGRPSLQGGCCAGNGDGGMSSLARSMCREIEPDADHRGAKVQQHWVHVQVGDSGAAEGLRESKLSQDCAKLVLLAHRLRAGRRTSFSFMPRGPQ